MYAGRCTAAAFLKDICEGVAGQAAEGGVAHQSLHQRLLERLLRKSPQFLQPERSLPADVGSFPEKEAFFPSTIAQLDFKGIDLATSLPEVFACKLFDADRNHYFLTQPGVAHHRLILVA